MRELRQLLTTGPAAGAPSGPEIGGLLIGSVSTSEISVDHIREIRRENRFGPFLLSSERDRAEAKRVALESGAVAGLFRSHSRPGEFLQKEDSELATLIGNISLVLIMQPVAPGRGVCHTYIPGVHGVWARAGSFSLPELQPVAYSLPAADADPELKRPSAPPRFSAWWVVALLAALSGGLAWYSFRPSRTPRMSATPAEGTIQRTDAGLELRLERGGGGDMRVQWNRAAPAIQKASGGWLRIQEGTKTRELDLDVDQLRSGNLLYMGGAGSDLMFRLEVFDATGQVTSESVRVIGGAAVSVPRAPYPFRGIQPAPSQGLADRGTPAASTQPLKPLQTPASTTAQPTPELPSPDLHASNPTLVPPPVNRSPSVPAPTVVAPQPAPQTLAPTRQPAAPPATQPRATAPAAQPAPNDVVVPARAIRQFRPAVPNNVKAMLTQDTSVTVMVVVNEQGKVVSATPQSTTGVIGQMLSGVATDAARAWRFEPARRNGKPISSTVSLVFRFSN
jgi:protein TonB